MLAQHWANMKSISLGQAWAITGPAVKPAVGQYQNANIGQIFLRILAQSWPNVPMLPGYKLILMYLSYMCRDLCSVSIFNK